MSRSTSTQKAESEMTMMKREIESMQKAYECLNPLIDIFQKNKTDLSKAVRSGDANKFWESIRTISKERDQLEAAMRPLQDHPKQAETQQSLSPGTRLRNERVAMSRSTSTQKSESDMTMMKKEVESIQKAFECLKPLIDILQKSKADFSKTVRSRDAYKFWEIIRALSKERDQLDAEMNPLQDHPKPDAQNRGGSGGSRGTDNRSQRAADPKSISQVLPERTREKGPTDGNRDFSKTMEPIKKDPTRTSPLHKTILGITVSSASTASKPDPPQPVEETDKVNEGSAQTMQLADKIKVLEKDISELRKEKSDLKQKNAQIEKLQNDLVSKINEKDEHFNVLQMRYKEAEANLKKKTEDLNALKMMYEEAAEKLKKKTEDCEALTEKRNEHLRRILFYENEVKKYVETIEEREKTIRTLGTEWENLNKEHTDLKSRFSKLAGDKLTDQNPDIADLSDPNRAMKLSEKFGALYDDAWTDAFENLTDNKKLNPRDAIVFLLDCLKECWEMCKKEAEKWMSSLENVFLHPIQDTEALSKMQGGKTAVRLGSKDHRVIRDACRKIAPTVGLLVKQCFISKMKKTQKLANDCLTYLEGCVDICWLMVLAEPPLHVEFAIKQGDKFDPNRHAAYSASGETVQFLVWPPLYNAEKGGGMLSKGTVSTERKVEKPKK